MPDHPNDLSMEVEDVEMDDDSDDASAMEFLRARGILPPSVGKRKAVVSPTPAQDSVDLETGLRFIKSTLKSAVSVTKMDAIKDVPGVHRLACLLADMSKTLEDLLSNKRLKPNTPTPSLTQKKSKCLEIVKPETVSPKAPQKPAMKDASTDTILTPSWWDSDSVFEAELAARKRSSARKPKAIGNFQDPKTRDTEAESAWKPTRKPNGPASWRGVRGGKRPPFPAPLPLSLPLSSQLRQNHRPCQRNRQPSSSDQPRENPTPTPSVRYARAACRPRTSVRGLGRP